MKMKHIKETEAAPVSGQHTPVPWKFAKHGTTQINTWIEIDTEAGIPIAVLSYSKLTEANAEFIVRACNCHDELVDTLQKIFNNAQARVFNGDFGAGHPDFDAFYSISMQAREALNKASR